MVAEALGASPGPGVILAAMRSRRLLTFVAVALLATARLYSDETRNLDRFFPGYASTLVVLDLDSGAIIRHNPELARRRFSPCSTFKVPNSLIGLETGVIPGPDFVLPWDGTHYEIAAWNRDHDLRSAIANSVVWYYRELARRVGLARMKEYVERFSYGNQDLSGGVDRFWLGSTLRISPEEQVSFLRRFETGDLGVSPRSLGIVKEIVIQPWAEGVVYRGKTGSCSNGDDAPDHGWWVGTVENRGHRYAFAALLEGKGASGRGARPMVEGALVELGVLPARPPAAP